MNQKKGGIILAYLSQLCGVLSGMLYTPYMLQVLGQAEYGLFSLASSTVSVLSMLNFGFSGCYLYFYNKYTIQKDEKAVGRFNATYLLIFLVISVLTLICGTIILLNIQRFFGKSLSQEEHSKASVLVAIMVLNIAVGFPGVVFSSGIHAKGMYVFENGYTLFNGLLAVAINVLILSMGGGSYGLALSALLFTIVKFFVFAYMGIRKLKMLFCFQGLRMSLLKTMFSFTFFIFLNQIINYLNGQLDKVLLGAFAGTATVAVYSVGSSLNSYYYQFSSSVANVFSQEINEIAASSKAEDREQEGLEQMTDVFLKVSRIQVFILMLVLTGFLLVGKSFVSMWAGEEYGEAFYIASGLMVAGSVAYFQTMGDAIQRAMFKHQIRSVLFFFMAVLNVILSIPLIKVMGALGAAIGTMIVWVLGDWFFLNWYYQYRLRLNMKRYWKSLLSIFKIIVPVYLLGMVARSFVCIESWTMLIIFAACYSLLYITACWKWAMNPNERKMVSSFLHGAREKLQKVVRNGDNG